MNDIPGMIDAEFAPPEIAGMCPGDALPDDAMDSVREEMRKDVVVQGRTALFRLMNGMTDTNASRQLCLIATLAHRYAELLCDLVPDAMPPRMKRASPFLNGGSMQLGDSMSPVYSSGVSIGGVSSAETFGAQMISQLVPLFMGKNTQENIPRLVSALADAREHGLDDIAAAIQGKLNDALGIAQDDPAPEDVPEEVPMAQRMGSAEPSDG